MARPRLLRGPPTANGRPGIHHVFSRTIKDLVCRFHAMQGKSVTRIAGWDTHGLPVEIEVEKELGSTGRRTSSDSGSPSSMRRARTSVFKYQSEWEELSDRIGYWLDYDTPTSPAATSTSRASGGCCIGCTSAAALSGPSGAPVLPPLRHGALEPRAGAGLRGGDHQLGLRHLPARERPKRELLIWTTTPWTLLSNVAVAVNPELEYAEYPVDGRP